MSLKNKYYIKNSLTQNRLNMPAGTPPCTSVKAGFTLEAAITLPIFVGFMVCIMFFFRIVQIQTKVEQALYNTSREVAAYACLEKSYSQVANPTTELVLAKTIFVKQLQAEPELMKFISGKAIGVSLLTSELEGNYVELCAVYRVRLPMYLLGIHDVSMQQKVRTRKWTGYQLAEESGDMVYITPTGKVYHLTQNCPYLDLSIHTASITEINVLRNNNGGKYKSCILCHGTGSMVYITDYGTKYHTDIACSALKRTVYRIEKTAVAERRACGKCGKYGGTE